MEEHSRSPAASSMRSEPRSGTHWPNNLRRSLLSNTPLSQRHVGEIETERHIVNRFTKIKIISQLLDCPLKKSMVYARTIRPEPDGFRDSGPEFGTYQKLKQVASALAGKT
jgi:hypothetical protein